LMTPRGATPAPGRGPNASERVGKHLNLDVAGPLEIFLEVHLPRSEGFLGRALRRLERRLELRLGLDQPHPSPPTPRDRLEKHRVAEARGFGTRLRVVGE